MGAPYEGNGAGAVYIYHGSATGLSSKKAAQVCNKVVIKLFVVGKSV